MALDSKIYEGLATVEGLHIVGGEANTPSWGEPLAVDSLDVTLEGIVPPDDIPERHQGGTRVARKYQLGSWAGRIVRNERQVSIGDADVLEAVADELGVATLWKDRGLDVALSMGKALAVNLIVRGDDLGRHLGPGAKLLIGTPETGAILDISEAHLPCAKPSSAMTRMLGVKTVESAAFKAVAEERRGFMAGVYSDGRISLGDSVAFQQPIDHRTERAPWKPDPRQ